MANEIETLQFLLLIGTPLVVGILAGAAGGLWAAIRLLFGDVERSLRLFNRAIADGKISEQEIRDMVAQLQKTGLSLKEVLRLIAQLIARR